MVNLTDLPDVLPLTRRNALQCALVDVLHVSALEWGAMSELPPRARCANLVLCVDLLFRPELRAPLAQTLVALAAPALLVWRDRGMGEDDFLQLLDGLDRGGFKCERGDAQLMLCGAEAGVRLALAWTRRPPPHNAQTAI